MARTIDTSRASRRLVAALALTGALVSASQAMAIPVGGGNTPPPNEIPVARITGTPNPVVIPASLILAPINTGGVQQSQALPVVRFGSAPVNFSAAASFDDDGSIVKYEWDLDGAPGFEKTTTTPRTTRSYSATGVIPARVRVTDDRGASDLASITITAHRAPVARITPSKTVAVVGDSVTFGSTASTDDNGIAGAEWDLDGDGTFERTGTQASTSFGTVGVHPISLRVTDILGAKSTTTLSLRVHRAPTALIVTQPAPPVVNTPTTLDGSRSSDDGTIARYEWDLNGDGTFETSTGAVPRATTTFTATGPATVGLKVTDNDGATDQTRLQLQVAATPVVTTDSLAPRIRPLATTPRMSALHRISFRIACPAGEQICLTKIQVKGAKGALAGRLLGSARVGIQGGRSKKVTIPLNMKAQRAIARGTLKARVVITATDASGNRATTRTAISIHR